MKKSMLHKAFSLIEVILSVFILGLLLGVGYFITYGSQFVSDVLKTEAVTIVATLRKAQMMSMYGVFSGGVTVHFDEGSLRVVETNEEVEFSGVRISLFGLSGGGRDVIFSREFGAANPGGTLTLEGPRGMTKTLTISPSGAIDLT